MAPVDLTAADHPPRFCRLTDESSMESAYDAQDPLAGPSRSARGSPSPRDPLYQGGGSSWAPDRVDIEVVLAQSTHRDLRSIYYGSNACYLVLLEHPDAGRSLAVYKPARGEYPLWDFPQGSLHRREVATYRLDKLVGWGIIPPIVIGSGRFGTGSVQLFIEQAERAEIPVSSLRRMVLLDWIANNADRKADHVLVSEDGRLWGIDHGLTFHAQPKLRTVLWHFTGEALAEGEAQDLTKLHDALQSGGGAPVTDLIDNLEARALRRRVSTLLNGGVFPDPRHKAMPYRW